MNATISSEALLAPVPTGLVLRSSVPTVDRILRESNPALAESDDSVVIIVVNTINVVWGRSIRMPGDEFF